MTRYVAFLRAINVGGHLVKMDQLRVLFEEMGFANVKTFIASGNVLFETSARDSAALEQKIGRVLRKALGYDVAVFLRTSSEVEAVCAEAGDPPPDGTLLVGFLPTPLDAREKKAVASMSTAVDELRAGKREVFWRAKQNFSGAIFQPAKMEKQLGKPATFRNATTVRKIAALLAKAVLLLAVLLPTPLHGQIIGRPPEVVAHRVTLVRDWARAVVRHVPGEIDAAILVTSTWTSGDLRDLWIGANVMNLLMKDSRARSFVVPIAGRPVPVEIAARDLDAIRRLAAELSRLPGADAFRKKAAVFHLDAAVLLVDESAGSPIYASFLLPRRVLVRTGDGEQEGLHGGDVNWEFARVLLDSVTSVGADADVRLWYQAALTHKLSREDLDLPHFTHAMKRFPRDPGILFLNGALHEAFAEARVQSAVAATRVPYGVRLDVDSEEAHLRKALDCFRHALELNPGHTETAIRHARTLGRLGRHAEAASGLRAVRDIEDQLLAYYAALFLGAEEEALGRDAQARAAYETALSILPEVPVPQLALSNLSHKKGDRLAARQVVTGLFAAGGRVRPDDPFWTYRLSAGRDADRLVTAVRRSVAGGTP